MARLVTCSQPGHMYDQSYISMVNDKSLLYIKCEFLLIFSDLLVKPLIGSISGLMIAVMISENAVQMLWKGFRNNMVGRYRQSIACFGSNIRNYTLFMI